MQVTFWIHGSTVFIRKIIEGGNGGDYCARRQRYWYLIVLKNKKNIVMEDLKMKILLTTPILKLVKRCSSLYKGAIDKKRKHSATKVRFEISRILAKLVGLLKIMSLLSNLCEKKKFEKIQINRMNYRISS